MRSNSQSQIESHSYPLLVCGSDASEEEQHCSQQQDADDDFGAEPDVALR